MKKEARLATKEPEEHREPSIVKQTKLNKNYQEIINNKRKTVVSQRIHNRLQRFNVLSPSTTFNEYLETIGAQIRQELIE